MEIYCTRPNCTQPLNSCPDLNDINTVKTIQQKYCIYCGMPLILDGRYIPSKLLGKGGFGAAFLARDRRTPGMRACVVKQFQPVGNLNKEQLEIAQNLFEREGIVLEKLGTHPQIPDLYAFFEQEKFFYLVQEFIDGKTLEELLTEKTTFSESEVIGLLQAILPVLKFVHENNSIHRDIKPSNIMYNQSGKLYLLDFGAVKQVAVTTLETDSARSTGIYTMGFAPPEQMRGEQVYPSTDLYALAVTCLQLLTGKPPKELFDGFNNCWNWRSYTTVSDSLAIILDKMLLTAPNQRFQSAEAVLQALIPTPPITTPSITTPSITTPPITTPSITTPPITTPPIITPPTTINKRFTILEILILSGFTGVEGGLLYIFLTALLPLNGSVLLCGMILGGLIYAQYRHILAIKELSIIAFITLILAYFFHGSLQIESVFFIPVSTGAGAIAFTALLRLVYKLVSITIDEFFR